MPLLPSLDAGDVWGDQLNDAIRALTRAPMSHSALTALTNVEEGTLVPCTTHGDIQRWSGSAWASWYAPTIGVPSYTDTLGIVLRTDAGGGVTIATSAANPTAFRARWASCTPVGSSRYKLEYFVEVALPSVPASGIAAWDMLMDFETAFATSGHFFSNPDYGNGLAQAYGAASFYDVSAGDIWFGRCAPIAGDDFLIYTGNASGLTPSADGHYEPVERHIPFLWAIGDVLTLQGSCIMELS